MLIKFPVERNIRVSKIRVSIHAWISDRIVQDLFSGTRLGESNGRYPSAIRIRKWMEAV